MIASVPDITLCHGDEDLRGKVLVTPCTDIAQVHVVVCGHSHVAPIRRAVVGRGEKTAAALGIAVAASSTSKSAEFWDFVTGLTASRDLAVVWTGNQVNAWFMFAPRAFDFVPSATPDCEIIDGAEIVPEAIVRDHFCSSLAGLGELLDKAGKAPGFRRYVLGTPPPLRDAELIRRRLTREPHFAALAQHMGVDLDTVPITPWQVRLKLWHVLQQLMQEIADEKGAAFVPAPSVAIDSDGCLKVDYSVGDVTHGATNYGEAHLDDLAAHLREAA